MSMHAHIETLSDKHNRLENAINEAYSHNMSDEFVRDLKKQKLRIKEEIESLLSANDN